jgi:hypothetical protein
MGRVKKMNMPYISNFAVAVLQLTPHEARSTKHEEAIPLLRSALGHRAQGLLYSFFAGTWVLNRVGNAMPDSDSVFGFGPVFSPAICTEMAFCGTQVRGGRQVLHHNARA